jgi:acyl carrier protein
MNDLESATKEIQQFLILELARRIEVDPELIDPAQPLERYGLDSLNALRLARELEDRIGCRLPTTVLWDYPTIDGLARYIADELGIRKLGPGRAGV